MDWLIHYLSPYFEYFIQIFTFSSCSISWIYLLQVRKSDCPHVASKGDSIDICQTFGIITLFYFYIATLRLFSV